MERKIRKGDVRANVDFWGTDISALLVTENSYTSRRLAMQPHVHLYYELVFNFSPIPLRHTVVSREYDTNTPCILFRAPYLMHSTVTLTEEKYSRCNIGFHPAVLSEYGGICDLGRLRSRRECMIPTTAEQMETLRPLLTRMKRVRDPDVPKKVWISTLATLLYEVSALAGEVTPEELPMPMYIRDLLRYVVENIHEDLTIDTLAEKFFVSRTKLTRDFRSYTWMSLHEYVSALRIPQAKMLLAEDLPLSIIAERCGFARDSTLGVMFRRVTGMTPGEYRHSIGR